MSLTITTQDYIEGKKFKIDGMTWEYVVPGAGITLDLSRAARKSTELDKKVADNTATEEEHAEHARLIEVVLSFYESMLRDGTKNNTQVKKWIQTTPANVIAQIIADIQKASEQ